MIRLLIALTVFACQQAWSQSTDNYVKRIEKLRSQGKLTAKTSIDKTFAGSVTAYYDKDSIVLISSLTDAEAAGMETMYFIKDGTVMKVYKMAATFSSDDEWKEYYSRHKLLEHCYECHKKSNCVVTEIAFGNVPTVFITEKRGRRELTGDDKEKILLEVKGTYEELKLLVNELE
jgi:hypothetical protein